MHSTIITCVAMTLITFELLGLGFPPGVILSLVALSVVVVGIPHGAADHLVGRSLLRPVFGLWWAPLFFAAYLTTSCLVLMGWYLWPAFTILTFFAFAAWHFGMQDRDEPDNGPLAICRAVACGGLVIWVPCTLQGGNIESLLTVISSGLKQEQASAVVASVAACSPVLGVFVVFDCLQELRSQIPLRILPARILRMRSIRHIAFFCLLCVANPLLSFAVYFCGWHSMRGLFSLTSEHQQSMSSLARVLAPMTLLTLGFIALASLTWSNGLSVSEATIRSLFLGLSAIAIPHLILHVIADSVELRHVTTRNLATGATT